MQLSLHGDAAGIVCARPCTYSVGVPVLCHGPSSVMHAAPAGPAGLGAWQPCWSAAACSGSARRQLWLALQRQQRPAEHSSTIGCSGTDTNPVAASKTFGSHLHIARQVVCKFAESTPQLDFIGSPLGVPPLVACGEAVNPILRFPPSQAHCHRYLCGQMPSLSLSVTVCQFSPGRRGPSACPRLNEQLNMCLQCGHHQ